MYHLLTYMYLFSKLSNKFVKLFSFLGHLVVFRIFRNQLQMYVNTLAVRTIIPSFNSPSGPETMQNYFHSYLTYPLVKCNLNVIIK